MIQLDGVSRWYGQVIGLNDVTCTIQPGLTALLGVNGAGKSTMMRLITGQIKPTTGEIKVCGMSPFGDPEVYRRIGYCPEIDNFYEHRSGREFVHFLGRLSGYTESEAKIRTASVLDRVGMLDRCDRKIAGYSKGMRQRIKLAQSIAHDPKVLVLDEPLNGLDPLVRSETIALFREFAAEGRHVILSSHVLHEVDIISDQVILLSGGYVIAEGQIRGVRGEIEDHPMQVMIRCRPGKALAARLFEQDYVVEVKVHADGGGLMVKTKNADSFFLMLNRLAMEGVPIETVQPADDDVNSVYEYLIGNEEAAR